jgi:hypothetical protein
VVVSGAGQDTSPGNGFASSTHVPGLNGSSSPGVEAQDTGGSSAPLMAIILAVVVLTAGGFIGARAMRRRRPQISDQG